MPSPRGIDSPRTDAGKHTLDFKSGGENDMFVKKATGTEDRRTRALAGMTLGSSLFGGVDESSAADGSCDDNSMSDTPESRVYALRGPPFSLDFPICRSSSSVASPVRRFFLMYVNLTYECWHILSEPNQASVTERPQDAFDEQRQINTREYEASPRLCFDDSISHGQQISLLRLDTTFSQDEWTKHVMLTGKH